jgi:spermidine synthase
VYALLELCIGAIGVLVLFGLPVLGGLYSTHSGHGVWGIVLRAVISAICLLPPTLLMGATLPAISRWVQTTPEGVAWLGFFYGGNTAGAVIGCLLAGFWLLRVYDMPTATYAAAAINVAVAAGGFLLSRVAPHGADGTRADEQAARAPLAWTVYVAIALSGFTALGAEVVWTRLLSLMLGATVYTFSIILAVFLVGIGLGSSAGAAVARRIANPRVALGVCQALLVATVAWAAFMIARALPYWPINPALASSPWFTMQLDLTRCLWAALPAACLWGASFPLALAGVALPGQDPGRMVGGVYAANTIGAIAGALAFSTALIPWIGTQHSQGVLVAGAAAAALLMLAPSALGVAPASQRAESRRIRPALAAATVVMLALAAWLARAVPAVPPELVAYGRYMVTYESPNVHYLYVGEGRTASIAVSELDNGVRNFHVSGKVEASTEAQDMRLQRMLGNLPALLHRDPKSVLVVGFGAGVTAGSFVPYLGVKRLVICEIEPLIPQHVADYFSAQNYDVLKDPRTELHFDDARHFVLTTPEKFDIITSDPINPWVKGAATLYTKEYFELVKAHLNPGGIVTQWVPLYEANEDAVKSEIATFFSVFPNGTIWGNTNGGQGYDIVLLGQADAPRIDLDSLDHKLQRDDFMFVRRSLADVGFGSAEDLLATYAGRAQDIAPWVADAQVNRDRDLRLQYLAGLEANSYLSGPIYSRMLEYRRFPDDLFTGSAVDRQALRQRIGAHE